MSTTPAMSAAAAEALVALLPTGIPLRAAVQADRAAVGDAPSAVVASFVGETSADLAVILADVESLAEAAGTESPLVSVTDLLRPALEAAAAVLGRGVLGDATVADASDLFADPSAVVFKLSAKRATAGWFAIRVRQNSVGGVPGRTPESSVVSKLNRINNVEMALTVEIGRTRMSVHDVLELEPGGVVELDRSAGAPADVLLNGRLIAHGEVVVIDQDYAVRITKILDVAEGLA
jgi:flagellar motor switch protein FliN/FliY